eukprot:452802-Rhodomonas_salina.1
MPASHSLPSHLRASRPRRCSIAPSSGRRRGGRTGCKFRTTRSLHTPCSSESTGSETSLAHSTAGMRPDPSSALGQVGAASSCTAPPAAACTPDLWRRRRAYCSPHAACPWALAGLTRRCLVRSRNPPPAGPGRSPSAVAAPRCAAGERPRSSPGFCKGKRVGEARGAGRKGLDGRG